MTFVYVVIEYYFPWDNKDDTCINVFSTSDKAKKYISDNFNFYCTEITVGKIYHQSNDDSSLWVEIQELLIDNPRVATL